MFRKPTVFILGAGASWHYGYPTGEDLVRKVIEQARQLEGFFGNCERNRSSDLPLFARRNTPAANGRATPSIWGMAKTEATNLAVRLTHVNPTLIDYFLRQNVDLHDIGKLTIAKVLFQCEFEYAHHHGNINRREQLNRSPIKDVREQVSGLQLNLYGDDWLRFVIYKLTSQCENSADLLENKVTFVTFNYDISLEKRIRSGLTNISHFQPGHIQQFLASNRFLHMYGKVGSMDSTPLGVTSLPTTGTQTVNETHAAMQMLDQIYEASKGSEPSTEMKKVPR